MTEEEALLRSMVDDRDRRIALVKHKTTDLNQKQQRLLDELDSATEQSARQQIKHQTEKTRMLHQHQAALEQLHQMEVDLQKQGSSLATYAKMVTVQAHDGIKGPNDVDEHHVMRMQAQLCKAMHSMGILDHQLELLQKLGKEHLKAMQAVKAQQREAKSQLELQLLNDLMASDGERRTKENAFKKEVADLLRQVKQMKKQVESDDEEEKNKEEKDSDDETERTGDDDDHEMLKAKEDLQKLLEQRKQQVKEFEQKLDEQEAELTKLREKLGNEAVKAPETRPPPVEEETPEEDEEEDEDEQEAAEEEEQNKARDEMAARLAQVMENAKLEDVEKEAPMSELDLLRMAQNRLNNTAPAVDEDDDDDEESSDDEEDSEEEYDSEEEREHGENDDNEVAAAVGESPRVAAMMEEEEKKTADDDDEEENMNVVRSAGDKESEDDDEEEGSDA